MYAKTVAVGITLLALSLAPVPQAQACVTKTGKDCDTTTAHKAYYTKKLIKRGPAGGVGDTVHKTGFDTLGRPSADVTGISSPAPQTFGSNPDGWFYLMPHSHEASGYGRRPMTYRTMSRVSDNNARLADGPIINPDGSLTALGIAKGFVRIAAPAPLTAGAPQAPDKAPIQTPNLQAQAPDPVATQAPALAQTPQNFGSNPDGWFYLMPHSHEASGYGRRPMTYRTMSRVSDNNARLADGPIINPDGSLTALGIAKGFVRIAAPAPLTAGAPQAPDKAPIQAPSLLATVPAPHALVRAPNLLPGHAAQGPLRGHPDQHVDVYHPTKAGVYRYQDAVKIGDPSFHFIVIGFKESK